MGATTGGDMREGSTHNPSTGYQWTKEIAELYGDKISRHKSTMPFVRRIDTTNSTKMSTDWTNQWLSFPSSTAATTTAGSATRAEAIDCFVDQTSGAHSVYVVGNVYNGAHMVQQDIELKQHANSKTGDIWVAKMHQETSDVEWLVQLGGEGNDRVSMTGKAIIMTNDGNVVIYGDTTSSLYRQRNNNNNDNDSYDMFVLTLNGKDGTITDQLYQGRIKSSLTTHPTNPNKPTTHPPKPKPTTPATATTTTTTSDGGGGGGPPATTASANTDDAQNNEFTTPTDDDLGWLSSSTLTTLQENKTEYILIGVASLSGLMALMCCVVWIRRRRNRKLRTFLHRSELDRNDSDNMAPEGKKYSDAAAFPSSSVFMDVPINTLDGPPAMRRDEYSTGGGVYMDEPPEERLVGVRGSDSLFVDTRSAPSLGNEYKDNFEDETTEEVADVHLSTTV